MRRVCILFSVIAIFAVFTFGVALADEPDVGPPQALTSVVKGEAVADAQPCCPGRSGRHCHGRGRCSDPCGGNGCGGGRDARHPGWSNCNCEGSYKFPVPPLYTYHWPGIYSQRLMTDYHSPWRFPPVVPYTEDPAEGAPPQAVTPNTFRHVSWEVRPIESAGDDLQMSERLERFYK